MRTREANWIDRGGIVGGAAGDVLQDDILAFREFRLAKVEQCRAGTSIRWFTETVEPSNLDFICRNIGAWRAPYHLHCYKKGWFSEVHADAAAAAHRIDEFRGLDHRVALLDDFFSRRKNLADAPCIYRAMAGRPDQAADRLVISLIDKDGRLPMLSVGRNSFSAKVMGPDWVNDINDGTFGSDAPIRNAEDKMKKGYFKAMDCGGPQYEEVLCLWPDPAGGLAKWICYDRVFWPTRIAGNREALISLTFPKQPGPGLILGQETISAG